MTVLDIPDAVDAAAANAAREVLADAPAEGDTLALVSGGHDSLTAMHLAYQHRRVDLDGVVHVNTGIGVPQTREFVRQRAAELGLDYHEVGAARNEPGDAHEHRPPQREYTSLVLEHGFPGPPVHDKMFINLKHEPLKAWIDASYPDREVTFVSGVSRHESERRMETVDETGTQEYLGCTTISPCVEFRGIDTTRYRSGLGLESNPVVERLEMSGECLCGAFADRGELRMLRLFYPAVWRYIKCLEARVGATSYTEDGPPEEFSRWGHGRFEDRERNAMDDGEQALLCSSCELQDECGESGCSE